MSIHKCCFLYIFSIFFRCPSFAQKRDAAARPDPVGDAAVAWNRTGDRGPGQPLERFKRVGVTPLNTARNKNTRSKTTPNLPVFRIRYKCTNRKSPYLSVLFGSFADLYLNCANTPPHAYVCARARRNHVQLGTNGTNVQI